MDEPILSAVQSVAQGAKTGILLGFYTQLILLCLGNYLVLITFIFSFYHLFAKSIFFLIDVPGTNYKLIVVADDSFLPKQYSKYKAVSENKLNK